MQNSVINTDFLIPAFMGTSQKSAVREIHSNDDTFMNMLNERIAAGNRNRTVSDNKARPVKMKAGSIKVESKEIQGTEQNSEVKAFDSKAVDTEKAKASVEVDSAAGKEDKTKAVAEESTETGTEEEINTLEAMIALLEELIARLETISVSAVPDSDETEAELILPREAEAVSPMELLMALVEGNIEKLKKLISELGQGQQSPETSELIEKIRSLIEKLDQSVPKDSVSELLAALAGKKEPTHAEILKGLKTKCEQLVQKLREQISMLRDDLQKNSEENSANLTIEVSREDPEKVLIDDSKPKTQADPGDSKEKAEASEQSPHSQVIDKNFGESFDKFVIPNDQTAMGSVKESPQTEQTPIILSMKPLEQTVTNQVVMKVKLMAGENRQEMEMHLKPESLGKLSLKIIHERGEILARITAENEQVKGILESNMQLLKDALEKNGYSVQSLSVSVGNDNGERRTKEEPGPGGKKNVGSTGRGEMKSSIIDAPDLRARIEKEYYGQSSRINLTA